MRFRSLRTGLHYVCHFDLLGQCIAPAVVASANARHSKLGLRLNANTIYGHLTDFEVASRIFLGNSMWERHHVGAAFLPRSAINLCVLVSWWSTPASADTG